MRAGGARPNSGLADDRKNRVFPEKTWGLRRVADGEIETRVWSFKGHVDFVSSYVALQTLYNGLPQCKRPHCAMSNTPEPMEEKQD